jgi:hypothetical protein
MNTKPRIYKAITPETVAIHRARKLIAGNGTAAVRQGQEGYFNPSARAHKIEKKSKGIATAQFIDEKLEQIGSDAINRLGDLVNSTDERIAQKSVHYTIDHIRGQATKKSISLTGKLNIQNVLD